MSPLSDTTNMASAVAGVNLFEHIHHMVYTITPTMVIALILYAIIDIKYSGGADFSCVVAMRTGILECFNVNPLLVLPPLLVIVMIALKLPALPGMLVGAILGSIFSVIFQGTPIGDIPAVWHYGFNFADPDSVLPELVNLLTRGGLDSMICPIVSAFYGFTGITMEKMTEEEYQQILVEREKEKQEALAALNA